MPAGIGEVLGEADGLLDGTGVSDAGDEPNACGFANVMAVTVVCAKNPSAKMPALISSTFGGRISAIGTLRSKGTPYLLRPWQASKNASLLRTPDVWARSHAAKRAETTTDRRRGLRRPTSYQRGMALPVAFADIEAAAARIADYIVRTPALPAATLGERADAEVFLKLETRQRTGAFKDRGAANRLLQLTSRERARGVIAMSAGNHAQAVAYQAARLGIAATIVMPENTPFTKVRRTQGFGARVMLAGDVLAEAAERAHAIAAAEGLTLIHPYDDERIIAGQGTAGLEFLRDVPDLDVLLVPVGGGGLIARSRPRRSARRSRSSACKARSTRHSIRFVTACPSLTVDKPSPKGLRSNRSASGRSRLRGNSSTMSSSSPNARSRARSTFFSRMRNYSSKAPQRPPSRRCSTIRGASRNGAWGSWCAAATSIRDCSPPSSLACA